MLSEYAMFSFVVIHSTVESSVMLD